MLLQTSVHTSSPIGRSSSTRGVRPQADQPSQEHLGPLLLQGTKAHLLLQTVTGIMQPPDDDVAFGPQSLLSGKNADTRYSFGTAFQRVPAAPAQDLFGQQQHQQHEPKQQHKPPAQALAATPAAGAFGVLPVDALLAQLLSAQTALLDAAGSSSSLPLQQQQQQQPTPDAPASDSVLDLLANLQRFEDQMSMLKRRVQQHAAAKLSTQQSHTAPAGAGTPGSSSTVQHTALQLQQVEPYQHESYPFNKTASPGQLTVPGSSSAAAAASPDRISKRLQFAPKFCAGPTSWQVEATGTWVFAASTQPAEAPAGAPTDVAPDSRGGVGAAAAAVVPAADAVPWPLISELALEVQRHVLTSVQCCQALAGLMLQVPYAAPGQEHRYHAAALHESSVLSGAAWDAGTCLQELLMLVLDPVPSGLGTVLQACRQWVCWLQEHAELAAALTDYVCAAAEVLLDLRDVQPVASSQAAYAKAVSAACVAGAALFEAQDRFPLFGPDPVSILRMATLMYTSSSSPLRSLLTRQALLKALAGQQHAQQHQGQQVQALAMLPAQAAEWLVLPEVDAAALRARAASLLQDRAFDQFDACRLAARGAAPVLDLGLAAHVEFIDSVQMWMAKFRDPVLTFTYKRAAPLPPLPPWNSEEQPQPEPLPSEEFTVTTERFEHTAVKSQLIKQQQYLEAALSSDLPAEVVLCYRATRALMYRRYARLRETHIQ